MDASARPLATYPVHLGLGSTTAFLPEFDGSPAWYERYVHDTEADGTEGRLVSLHTFTEPWTTWEMHPHGAELVVCTSGTLVLIQQTDAGIRSVTLGAGDAVVNPPGVWHTADVDVEATVLFVTAGVGTENRAR